MNHAVPLFLALLAGTCLAAAEPGPTDLLVVEIGAKDGAAAAAWCRDGRRLVQALTTDPATVTAARATWDKAGLTGRATIVQVPDFKHLPYGSALVDLVVVQDWSTVNAVEIARVVVPPNCRGHSRRPREPSRSKEKNWRPRSGRG